MSNIKQLQTDLQNFKLRNKLISQIENTIQQMDETQIRLLEAIIDLEKLKRLKNK